MPRDSKGCLNDGQCIVWQTSIGTGIAASPQFSIGSGSGVRVRSFQRVACGDSVHCHSESPGVFSSPAEYTQTVLMVSGTSLQGDCCGSLYGLNASSGAVLWQLNTTDSLSPTGSYGLFYVPAIDPT